MSAAGDHSPHVEPAVSFDRRASIVPGGPGSSRSAVKSLRDECSRVSAILGGPRTFEVVESGLQVQAGTSEVVEIGFQVQGGTTEVVETGAQVRGRTIAIDLR